MPDAKTVERVRRDRRAGKSPGTQAGEFVRQEIEHVRAGKHGVKSPQQAIAIGLSEARRAGVAIPAKGQAAKKSPRKRPAARKASSETTATRRRASTDVLKKEGRQAVSKPALARQARKAAAKRSPASRAAAAKKAAHTKGPAVRRAAAKKAARTRASRARGK